MITIILAAAVASSRPTPVATQDQWLACARSVAEARLEQGIPATWPKVDSLPSGESPAMADLGSSPDEPAYDPMHRVLYGYSSRNAIYIESFGGIRDVHTFYGPISLESQCVGAP